MSIEYDIDNITYSMNYVYVDDNDNDDDNDDANIVNTNQELISYIMAQTIDQYIKERVIALLENDSYNNYCDIYNICLDNNIELPPLI